MKKEKKKTINVLTAFFIFYKSDVKNFFNWIFNQYPKSTRKYFPCFNYPCIKYTNVKLQFPKSENNAQYPHKNMVMQ